MKQVRLLKDLAPCVSERTVKTKDPQTGEQVEVVKTETTFRYKAGETIDCDDTTAAKLVAAGEGEEVRVGDGERVPPVSKAVNGPPENKAAGGAKSK